MKKTFVICLLVLFSGPSIALSQNAKIYPGAMAVRSGANQPVPELNNGAIENSSSSEWLYVSLPCIKNAATTSIRSGYVKVVDKSPTRNISAVLCAVYISGNGTFYGSFSGSKYSSGSKLGVQTLSFGGLSATRLSHYYYNVNIPPAFNGNRSSVISYMLNDN